MPAPFTVVTFKDENGIEFPVRLPGIYKTNKGADIEAGLQIAGELIQTGEWTPDGALRFKDIEYLNELPS